MRQFFCSLILAFAVVMLALPGAASELMAVNARIDPPFGDEAASLYFAIQNRGKETRKIVAGSCAGCTGFEIRRAMLQDGAMVDVVLPEWEIPAGGSVAFAPRGLSIALIGLADLSLGDSVSIELEFADGEKVEFEATVQE